MIDMSKYNLMISDNCDYIVGYKYEIMQMLKDRIKNYVDEGFEKETIVEELERLEIVRKSKYEKNDLLKLEFNDEEKSHIPTKPIARVKVLVPYGNGFSGNDVVKYLV